MKTTSNLGIILFVLLIMQIIGMGSPQHTFAGYWCWDCVPFKKKCLPLPVPVGSPPDTTPCTGIFGKKYPIGTVVGWGGKDPDNWLAFRHIIIYIDKIEHQLRESHYTVKENCSLQIKGDDTLDGSMTLEKNSRVVNSQLTHVRGVLKGNGTWKGDLTVVDGLVAPGMPAGTLTVDGKYTMQEAGTLAIVLGGSGATDYDRIVLTRPAQLGGTLVVNLVGGFKPTVRDHFDIVTAGGGIRGDFLNFVMPEGYGWRHYAFFDPSDSIEKYRIECTSVPGIRPATILVLVLLLAYGLVLLLLLRRVFRK